MKAKNVAVLGGGSFGTVIANIIAQNGHNTLLWMRDAEQVEILNRDRENLIYLPGFTLHEKIKAIQSLEMAVEDADMVFVAVPSSGFRDVVKKMQPFVKDGVILVSLTKGIEAGTFKLMSQILSEEIPNAKVAVVSGPNLAKEIASSSPTGSVVASTDAKVRTLVQKTLRSLTFRVYANDDMLGVELGGSLKNIYAILAGMAESRGMGHNTNSMLVTRSLTEMARFGLALGAALLRVTVKQAPEFKEVPAHGRIKSIGNLGTVEANHKNIRTGARDGQSISFKIVNACHSNSFQMFRAL